MLIDRDTALNLELVSNASLTLLFSRASYSLTLSIPSCSTEIQSSTFSAFSIIAILPWALDWSACLLSLRQGADEDCSSERIFSVHSRMSR